MRFGNFLKLSKLLHNLEEHHAYLSQQRIQCRPVSTNLRQKYLVYSINYFAPPKDVYFIEFSSYITLSSASFVSAELGGNLMYVFDYSFALVTSSSTNLTLLKWPEGLLQCCRVGLSAFRVDSRLTSCNLCWITPGHLPWMCSSD